MMQVHVMNGEKGLSNTYFLLNGMGEAIVIDPGDYAQIKKYLCDNNITVKYAILTHGHWDHIMGLNQLREDTDCVVISTIDCSDVISCSKKNLSRYRTILAEEKMDVVRVIECNKADVTFKNECRIEWDGQVIRLIETRGHSAGDCCILTGNYLFAGDMLLENVEDIFRMPGAVPKAFYEETLPVLININNDCSDITVYPGHNKPMKLNDILYKISKETEWIR